MVEVTFRTTIKYDRIPEITARFPGAVRAAVAKAAYDTEADAKTLCPVDTGALRGSIKTQVEGASARVTASMEYAGYVEFGTYKMAPRAFMRPAADINEPKFIAAMEALAAHL